jgi:subtilisin family serine protease
MSNITFLPLSDPTISVTGGVPARFSMTNLSNEHLSVYWVDRSGNLKLYYQLDKGVSYIQQTASSDTWEVTSADGKVAFKFTPSGYNDITINADYKASYTDHSETIRQTVDGPWSTAQGYGLINVAKSLGIADTAALPVNAQNNNLALDEISAPAAWAAGYTGKGVKVAVVDNGIAAHPEINGAIAGGIDLYDHDAVTTPNDGAYKDNALDIAVIIAGSHSAHAGQDTMGIAPDATLLDVRVGPSAGSFDPTTIANGIIWAVDNGAKVISVAIQGTSTTANDAYIKAIDYAYQHNVVAVVMGGNFGSYGAVGPALAAQQAHGEAIVVGNYNPLTGTAAQASNMPADASPFPWVMAGSTGYVPNSAGGYNYNDGNTALAGAYVSGLAALLFQQNPNATAADIINKIVAGADIGGNAASASLPAVTQGTAGLDTHTFHGAAAGYSISTFGGVTTVTDNHGADGVVTLANVERLAFSDENIALDVSGNAGEAYRLYQAAFNRAPDKGGLGFWINTLDSGASLAQVATNFVNSDEFHQLYGTNPSGNDLVTAMYHNVLHRVPDAGGLSYWLDQLSHGTTTAQLLTDFSESAENQTTTAQLIGKGIEYQAPHG